MTGADEDASRVPRVRHLDFLFHHGLIGSLSSISSRLFVLGIKMESLSPSSECDIHHRWMRHAMEMVRTGFTINTWAVR